MDLTGLPLTQEQESWLRDRVIEDSKLSLPTIENEYSLTCEFLFHFYFDCELNLKYEFKNDGTFELPSDLVRLQKLSISFFEKCYQTKKINYSYCVPIFLDIIEKRKLKDESKTIIICPKCSKNYKVPVNKNIEVTCKECKHIWITQT
jgi:hypothetical protein